MKFMFNLAAIFIFTAFAGCSTPYQEYTGIFSRGGYVDMRVGEGKYVLYMYLNSFTTDKTGDEYLTRRVSEICSREGYVGAKLLSESHATPPDPNFKAKKIEIQCLK